MDGGNASKSGSSFGESPMNSAASATAWKRAAPCSERNRRTPVILSKLPMPEVHVDAGDLEPHAFLLEDAADVVDAFRGSGGTSSQ